MVERPRQVWLRLAWLAIAAGLFIAALTLAANGHRFAWVGELADRPAIALAVGAVLAGLVFVNLGWLIPMTLRSGEGTSWRWLAFVIVIGYGLRLTLLWSTPALEDDFYRYLWDGGVVVAGYNPYAIAPADIFAATTPEPLQHLAEKAGAVFERVNHPEIRTIYPPVAQFWFAVAHLVEPWSLLSWRLIGLAAESLTLLLLLALLQTCARSPLWSALYWWNPLVIKELVNSAHMEFVLLPLVLAALLLASRRRYLLSCIPVGLAIGTKLWPVMLLPVLLRPLLAQPWRLFAAGLILLAMGLAWALPPLLAGIDESSGFVAFATHWQTNSALFQHLKALASTIGEGFNLTGETAGLLLRAALAGVVGVIALAVSARRYEDAMDLVRRSAWIIAAVFLLSPAQFPWYATWVMILLPFLPLPGLLALTVTLPIYYVSFHFAAMDRYEIFNTWVLWIIWLPVWLLLAHEGLRAWYRPMEWNGNA